MYGNYNPYSGLAYSNSNSNISNTNVPLRQIDLVHHNMRTSLLNPYYQPYITNQYQPYPYLGRQCNCLAPYQLELLYGLDLNNDMGDNQLLRNSNIFPQDYQDYNSGSNSQVQRFTGKRQRNNNNNSNRTTKRLSPGLISLIDAAKMVGGNNKRKKHTRKHKKKY